LGVIALADSNQERQFDHEDLRLITLFAHQAAIAIKNAQLFEEVQKLAETDELTKIHNRRQLFNIGEREFERSKRYNQPLSVIMLDIDNFKLINDTYGHAVGDVVLYSLAQNCLINIREIDSIGRYGGEEFVILLPHTKLELGCEIGERLQSYIGSKPISTEVGALKISISMGIAERDDSMPNLAALIDRADTALYKAKNSGRNRIEIYKSRQGMKITHLTK
jgi:diguanylate cyclase (GGDEF)-like protein